ncbi:MAG TPA: gluconate 2-dehydrogenase subunit 3 family protein, partial [Thermoleophilaceae bacterium]|nr:gluconate 2-dehydrogenase subunit 3 family protein [Thermoleophilaceae bacterium]
MAATIEVLTEAQRATLAAVCDTYVPAVDSDTHDAVEREFMGRSASDMGIPARIEGVMAETMSPEEIAAFGGLLDALAGQGIVDLPVTTRTEVLHGTAAADPEAKVALHSLKGLTMLLFYALPDERGANPNWEAIGYPGPVSSPPAPEEAPKTIALAEVEGEKATLSVDA